MQDRPGKDVTSLPDGLLIPEERVLFETVNALRERSRQLIYRARFVSRPREFLRHFPPGPRTLVTRTATESTGPGKGQ